MNKDTQIASVSLPLAALKFLYKSNDEDKIVCEIDIESIKKANKISTIDNIIADAELEYFSGNTKGFTDMNKFLNHLEN